MRDKQILSSNLEFLRKIEIDLPDKNLILSYRIPTVKRQTGLCSLVTKLVGDARLSIITVSNKFFILEK